MCLKNKIVKPKKKGLNKTLLLLEFFWTISGEVWGEYEDEDDEFSSWTWYLLRLWWWLCPWLFIDDDKFIKFSFLP